MKRSLLILTVSAAAVTATLFSGSLLSAAEDLAEPGQAPPSPPVPTYKFIKLPPEFTSSLSAHEARLNHMVSEGWRIHSTAGHVIIMEKPAEPQSGTPR